MAHMNGMVVSPIYGERNRGEIESVRAKIISNMLPEYFASGVYGRVEQDRSIKRYTNWTTLLAP